MTHPIQSAPRELTVEEQQQRAEAMFELDQRIKTGLRAGRSAMWDVAAASYAFDEENGWSALGYDRLAEWLADPEVTMSRATFYRLVQAYRETVERRQIPLETMKQVDYSKVDIVIGKVNRGEAKIEDALEDMKELGARDLREVYIGPRKPHQPKDEIPDPGTYDGSADEVDLDPDAPPVLASQVAQNPPGAGNGQVPPTIEVDPQLDHVLLRIWREVAPARKKHMRRDLRDELEAIMFSRGLLDD